MNHPATRFYQVREPKGHEWARIWITNDGCISILSDYGDFGYWFGDPGGEFRRFLTQCDDYYIQNKLSGGKKELDERATEKAAQRIVLEARREGRIDRDQARNEWEMISQVDWGSEYSRCKWYFEETQLNEDATESSQYRTPTRVRMFVERLWPIFIEQLRRELAIESALAHPGFED